MSDSYAIGCDDCKKSLTIGQAAGGKPFCFYSGETETMRELKEFLYAHFGHKLRFYFADVLEDDYETEQVSAQKD